MIKELSLADVMPKTYFFDMNQPKFTEEEKEFFHKHKTGVWIKKVFMLTNIGRKNKRD